MCQKCGNNKCCCRKVISVRGPRGKAGKNGTNGRDGAAGADGATGPAGPAGPGTTWYNLFVPDPGSGLGIDIYNGGAGTDILVDAALGAGSNVFWWATFFIQGPDVTKLTVGPVINSTPVTTMINESNTPQINAGTVLMTHSQSGFCAYSPGQNFKFKLKSGLAGYKVRTIQVNYFVI